MPDFALDPDQCYRAASSRDSRFDGQFIVAVRTTRIYCRPSCPAVTPRRANVEFYRSAAAAQHGGYRACKRCRPDAAPGSSEWNVRGDLVGRAMRLLADGVVDREGVDGLARRLGYSARQLNRVLTDELGAGPLALARAQRAHTARTLIETTTLSMTDVAFAAGFGSVRQFNDTFREVYDSAPLALRTVAAAARDRGARPAPVSGAVSVRLPARQPFAAAAMLQFMAARLIAGVEAIVDRRYVRALDLPRGHGVAEVALGETAVEATLWLADWRDLAPAVDRIRRLFDLDADPVAIDSALGSDTLLAPLVRATPGLRVPGSVDAWETTVRAIVGQQVSVAGARTVLGRIVAALGEPLAIEHPAVTRVFPTAARVADANRDVFPMPATRAATLAAAAAAVDAGAVCFDADRGDVRRQLVALRGIGAWTADYIVMRALRDPDVFLATDLGVRHALDRLDAPTAVVGDGAVWRPWRSYALHHLWFHLATGQPAQPAKETT